ncbi:MAG: Rrf2 family transcriptional regulator [Proteobacteria bacterium]|nr:Rrf2 family transcriptional regulator [Pseudomonadota bacterium]
MQVSRELDYGVRAMVVLSAHDREILSKRKIAKEFRIPVNFLALILPKLVRSRLVESLPGPKGGYRLARPASRISMYDVIIAIEDEVAFNLCLRSKSGCEEKQRCPVTHVWRKMQCDAMDYLKGVSFEKLSQGFGR